MLVGETCNIALLRLPFLIQEKVIQCVEPGQRNLWENMLIYISMNMKVYPVPFSLKHPSEKWIDVQYLELFLDVLHRRLIYYTVDCEKILLLLS